MYMMKHTSAYNPYILEFNPPLSGNGQSLQHLKVAVKDLFHIAGYPTTAGNPDWLKSHAVPTSTSPVINTLLNEGACIVGKTITDELAYSLNGQNIHYGTPVNGIDAALLPGGSSSGSASAVAQGRADIGLGTDTGGSIRIPASYNQLFGLRPSHGVISTEHLVGLAPSFDTVGWMTRDLNTLIKVADVLLATLAKNPHQDKIRVGYMPQINMLCDQQMSLNKIVEGCKNTTNLSVVDVSSVLKLADLHKASAAFRILQGAEIWATHGRWIEEYQPTFALDIVERFTWCKGISVEQQAQASELQSQFNAKIAQLFEQVDYILMPTTPGSAPLLTINETDLAAYRNTLLSMTCIAGLAGLPQLQLPLKLQKTGPMGVSILGQKYHDRDLLEFAKTLLELL